MVPCPNHLSAFSTLESHGEYTLELGKNPRCHHCTKCLLWVKTIDASNFSTSSNLVAHVLQRVENMKKLHACGYNSLLDLSRSLVISKNGETYESCNSARM